MGINGLGAIGFGMLCFGIAWYLFTWYEFFPLALMAAGLVVLLAGVDR